MKSQNKYWWTIIFFAALGLIALQINLNHIAGSKVNFTMFDSFGPLAGTFLGPVVGTISLVVLQLINALVHKQPLLNIAAIVHMIPVLGAAWYFRKRNVGNIIIPLIAIVAFNLNPVGRSVWYYSLYWLIPVGAYFLQNRWLWARSLGAAFTAHAVGGALWIWLIPLPRTVWIGLIPIIPVERLLLAGGMMVSYVAVKGIVRGLAGEQSVKISRPVPADQA